MHGASTYPARISGRKRITPGWIRNPRISSTGEPIRSQSHSYSESTRNFNRPVQHMGSIGATMKIRNTAAAAILGFGVLSCTSDLHKDPIGLLTPEQISTEPTLNSVTLSVTSSYQMLASTLNLLNEWRWDLGTVFRDDFVVNDIASDDVQKKWNPDGDQAWMDQVQSFNFTSSNQAFNGQWTYDYEGISRANLAISYLTDPAITAKIAIDPVLKNRILG